MQLSLKFRESTKNALFCPKMPLNDVIFEQTKLQKLDWDIMNMFQSQSVNIYGKRANARGGALCAPPHQPSMKKSPSGLGLMVRRNYPNHDSRVINYLFVMYLHYFAE